LHGLQELHFAKQNHDPGINRIMTLGRSVGPGTVTILFIEVDFLQAIDDTFDYGLEKHRTGIGLFKGF
jgi:hypothetical protein